MGRAALFTADAALFGAGSASDFDFVAAALPTCSSEVCAVGDIKPSACGAERQKPLKTVE